MDASHGRLFQLALWCAVFGAGTGGWFAYFRLKERTPRPFLVMLAATLGGFAAAIASVLVYEKLEMLAAMPSWSNLESGGLIGLQSSLLIGLVEEGTKLVPTFLVVMVSRRVERTQDAIFIAACAGVGFAAAENMLLWEAGMSGLDALARAVASPVTHALFAAPWGLGLGRLVRTGQVRTLVLGFAASVMAHAVYDLLLAAPNLPHAVAAGEVLVLWVWMLVRTAPSVIARVTSAGLPAMRRV